MCNISGLESRLGLPVKLCEPDTTAQHRTSAYYSLKLDHTVHALRMKVNSLAGVGLGTDRMCLQINRKRFTLANYHATRSLR